MKIKKISYDFYGMHKTITKAAKSNLATINYDNCNFTTVTFADVIAETANAFSDELTMQQKLNHLFDVEDTFSEYITESVRERFNLTAAIDSAYREYFRELARDNSYAIMYNILIDMINKNRKCYCLLM